jgi:ribosomal protein L37E
MSRLEWAGFQRLRVGRIHVYCPRCGRKFSNAERGEYDPPRATLVHTWCYRCGVGGKDSPETFFDDDGKEIEWAEVEATIEAVIAARESGASPTAPPEDR